MSITTTCGLALFYLLVLRKKKRIHNCPVPDVGLRRVKTKIRTTWATNARISKIPEGSPEGIHELSNTQKNLTIHKQSLRGEESKQLSKVNATMKKTECVFFQYLLSWVCALRYLFASSCMLCLNSCHVDVPLISTKSRVRVEVRPWKAPTNLNSC